MASSSLLLPNWNVRGLNASYIVGGIFGRKGTGGSSTLCTRMSCKWRYQQRRKLSFRLGPWGFCYGCEAAGHGCYATLIRSWTFGLFTAVDFFGPRWWSFGGHQCIFNTRIINSGVVSLRFCFLLAALLLAVGALF
jgi:hypothetical protein